MACSHISSPSISSTSTIFSTTSHSSSRRFQYWMQETSFTHLRAGACRLLRRCKRGRTPGGAVWCQPTVCESPQEKNSPQEIRGCSRTLQSVRDNSNGHSEGERGSGIGTSKQAVAPAATVPIGRFGSCASELANDPSSFWAACHFCREAYQRNAPLGLKGGSTIKTEMSKYRQLGGCITRNTLSGERRNKNFQRQLHPSRESGSGRNIG
eukprot:2316940-Rhodomonas_salina.3